MSDDTADAETSDDDAADVPYDTFSEYPMYMNQEDAARTDEARRAWILEMLLKIPDGIVSMDWRTEAEAIERYLKNGHVDKKLKAVK